MIVVKGDKMLEADFLEVEDASIKAIAYRKFTEDDPATMSAMFPSPAAAKTHFDQQIELMKLGRHVFFLPAE